MPNPLQTLHVQVARLRAAVTRRAAAKPDPRSRAGTDIPVRNRRFDVGSVERTRYWHAGGAAVTIFFDNLSIFFPPGERFFMRSVKQFRHHAPAGSDLASAVAAFLAQEAYHGREHRAYNARLEALGYPAVAMEKRVEALLDVVIRVIPPRLQLAATCALEHYTAFMGHQLLESRGLLDGSDPEFAALWKWHAVEENEHRAVAFDLFMAAGGTRTELRIAMVLATAIFWAKVLEHQVRMMHAAGLASSVDAWKSLYRFMFVSPGNLGGLPSAVRAFMGPSFHPEDVPVDAVIDAWRREAGEAQ